MDSTIWYSCNYCRRVFNEKGQLNLHKKNQHLNEIKATILKKRKSIMLISDVNDEGDDSASDEDYNRNEDKIEIVYPNDVETTTDNDCEVVNAFDILPPTQNESGESSADPILTLHYCAQQEDDEGDNEYEQVVDNTSSPLDDDNTSLPLDDEEFPIQNDKNDVSNDHDYDNDNNNSFVPNEPEDSIEVIYLDSDTDEEDDPSTMVDTVINAENTSSDDKSSVIVHTSVVDTLTHHHPDQPPPATSSSLSSTTTTNNSTSYNSQTELTTVRPSSKKQKCQKSMITTSTPAIDKFLWCPVCLLPYTQISSLKRHMIISHRNGKGETVRKRRGRNLLLDSVAMPRNYELESNLVSKPVANNYRYPHNGTNNSTFNSNSNDMDMIESGGGSVCERAECVVGSYVSSPFLMFGEHY